MTNCSSCHRKVDRVAGVVRPRKPDDDANGIRLVLPDLPSFSLSSSSSCRGYPAEDMGGDELTHPTFLPTPDDPLFSLFVSRVEGGVVVSVVAHHTIMDGPGLFTVAIAIAEASRGVPLDQRSPLHDDRSLLQPKGQGPTMDHPEYEVIDPSSPPPSFPTTMPTFTVRYIKVPPRPITTIKTQASSHGHRLSTNDIVSALLWRACTRARGLPPTTPTRLGFAYNGRERLEDPQLPQGYIGNVNLYPTSQGEAGELVSSLSLWQVAVKVRHATDSMTSQRIRSSLEFIGQVSGVEMRTREARGNWFH